MVSGPKETRLKVGPHRSVHLSEDPVHGPVILKRYRSSGAWRRFRDGLRARHEMKMLTRLRDSGLRVPQPHSCERREGVWTLCVQAVQGARSLSEFLAPLSPIVAPGAKASMARNLGTLVGHAHALGLDHGDLHGGNLLLDEEGDAWLIDVPKARVRKPATSAIIERDLIVLNAEAREFVPRDLLHRFWASWRKSFLAHGGAPTLASREMLKRVESGAITHRRDSLKQHEDRWVRESGVCEVREHNGKTVLAAKNPAASAWFENESQHIFTDTVNDEVFHAWKHVGRAWQHGLPCVIPLYLEPGTPPRAVYLLPRALVSMGLALNWRNTDFFAALRERELDLSPRSQPVEAGGGNLLFGARCRLVPPRVPLDD
jgi:tRNA A-37 threonylcarbamoyl transferase component Bud32